MYIKQHYESYKKVQRRQYRIYEKIHEPRYGIYEQIHEPQYALHKQNNTTLESRSNGHINDDSVRVVYLFLCNHCVLLVFL